MPPPEESPRRRHRFRGLLLKLGVFLLLGVVVNVAVAWGCAASFPTGPPLIAVSRSTIDSNIVQHVTHHLGLLNGFQPQGNVSAGRCAARTYHAGRVEFRVPGSRRTTVFYEIWDDGWPLRALRGEHWFGSDISNQNGLFGVWKPTGISPTLFARCGSIGLAYQPIALGFAINTIFYAAMLWLLWVAPGKIRRFIRIRGHRCPACGYIIAPGTAAASPGGGPCSECGHVRD
jgi:hypothetical protein